jgi:hypothetical protein
MGVNRYEYFTSAIIVERVYLVLLILTMVIIMVFSARRKYDRELVIAVIAFLGFNLLLKLLNPPNSEYLYSAGFLLLSMLAFPLLKLDTWLKSIVSLVTMAGYLYFFLYYLWLDTGVIVVAIEKYSILYYQNFGIGKTGFSGFLGGPNSAGAIYMFTIYLLKYKSGSKFLWFIMLYILILLSGSLTAAALSPIILYGKKMWSSLLGRFLALLFAFTALSFVLSVNLGGGITRLERYIAFFQDMVLVPWKIVIPRNLFLPPFYSESTLVDVFHNTGLIGMVLLFYHVFRKAPMLFFIMALTNSVVNPMNMLILTVALKIRRDD